MRVWAGNMGGGWVPASENLRFYGTPPPRPYNPYSRHTFSRLTGQGPVTMGAAEAGDQVGCRDMALGPRERGSYGTEARWQGFGARW